VVGRIRFDWRWIALIVFVALIVNAGRLPWQVVALLLGGAGAYLVALGWRAWTRAGGPPGRGRVTYWRGQRIEAAPPRRGPALPRWSDIGPAAVYFVLGGALLLAALTMLLDAIGA
jgi:hypothetical protein